MDITLLAFIFIRFGRVGIGVGVGTVVAALMSFERNKSVPLCILHALCGWFYVIWWLLTRKK